MATPDIAIDAKLTIFFSKPAAPKISTDRCKPPARRHPFGQLAEKIAAPKHSKSGRVCKPWLDVKGGFALQFLKHFLRLSDAMLIERFNTNWSLQYFCGIQLKEDQATGDKNLPSIWRSYIGKHLDIKSYSRYLPLAGSH